MGTQNSTQRKEHLQQLFCTTSLRLPHSDCISRAKRKRPKHTDTDDVEHQTERETGHDDELRGEMLKVDGIIAAEKTFMQGRDTTPDKRKHPAHNNTVSVDLAEDEHKED